MSVTQVAAALPLAGTKAFVAHVASFGPRTDLEFTVDKTNDFLIVRLHLVIAVPCVLSVLLLCDCTILRPCDQSCCLHAALPRSRCLPRLSLARSS